LGLIVGVSIGTIGVGEGVDEDGLGLIVGVSIGTIGVGEGVDEDGGD